jgi:hypothetical protein
MKSLPSFALVVLFGVPATAQQLPAQRQPPAQRLSIEVELLELEQEVDKSILREALSLLGRKGMIPSPSLANTKDADDVAVLRDFVAKKKEAIITRAAELGKSRGPSMRGSTASTVSTADQPAKVDRQAAIEKIDNAQIDAQLLQAQINLLQPDLANAIDALAAADIAASKDEGKRGKAAEARKEYEKIKARFVEHSKRLQLEQEELQSMQRMMGMVGMGGMGGGMR